MRRQVDRPGENRICPQCGQPFHCSNGRWNRAQKDGAPVYCGRVCAGLARRQKNPPTESERKAAKAEYDREYRRKNAERLRLEKAERHKRTYDPEKARAIRAVRMPYHVQYCRQPWYKAWKREYDRKLRASKYGDFAEAFLLLQELKREIEAHAGEEVNLDKAKEKSNERRRPGGENPDRGQPETGSLGNAE